MCPAPRQRPSPMDTIYVHGLTVQAHIGVTDEERATAQTLRLDIEAAYDAPAAAATDDIEHAVNYHALVNAVVAHITPSAYRLLEALAEHLAALILREFDVSWVALKIGKPDILDHVDEVGIAIERLREESAE